MSKVFESFRIPRAGAHCSFCPTGPMVAGELSEYFSVSKPTMSAHFAVLRQAGRVEAERSGKTIIYRLEISVLEDALLEFAQAFGLRIESDGTNAGDSDAPKKEGRPS